MSAPTPGYNSDVLSELAEKYERSKVFLQELEQSLQKNLKADRGEMTPATVAQGASATANRTSGIKSRVVDFFSGATFKGTKFKGAASSSPRAPVPEVDGVEVDALRRPSVVNLALDQLDVEAELVPVRRATSFQTFRRASVALVPSTALARQPSNGVAPPLTQANARPPQRQQEDSPDNRRSTCNGLPGNPPLRRARTEQARLAQSVRWSLMFAENPSVWPFSDAAGRRPAFLQSPCTSSTGDEPAQVHDFITPPLNSALYTSQPPERTLPPGRENSMRGRSHSRRGSEQDSVFATGSDAGTPRRLPVPSLSRSPSVSQLPALPSPRRQSKTVVPSVPSILLTASRSTGGGTRRARKAWQATPQGIMTSMPSLDVGGDGSGDGSDDGSAEADGEGSTGDVDVAALLSTCLYNSGSTSGLDRITRSLADSGERPLASPRTTHGVGSLSGADAQAACGCLAQMELPRKSKFLHPTPGVSQEGRL